MFVPSLACSGRRYLQAQVDLVSDEAVVTLPDGTTVIDRALIRKIATLGDDTLGLLVDGPVTMQFRIRENEVGQYVHAQWATRAPSRNRGYGFAFSFYSEALVGPLVAAFEAAEPPSPCDDWDA